jgi:hypothetical protein
LVLDLEGLSRKARTSSSSEGDSRFDPNNEPREPSLGRAATFLNNHVSQLASVDFFTVHTVCLKSCLSLSSSHTIDDVLCTLTSRRIPPRNGPRSKRAKPFRSIVLTENLIVDMIVEIVGLRLLASCGCVQPYINGAEFPSSRASRPRNSRSRHVRPFLFRNLQKIAKLYIPYALHKTAVQSAFRRYVIPEM